MSTQNINDIVDEKVTESVQLQLGRLTYNNLVLVQQRDALQEALQQATQLLQEQQQQQATAPTRVAGVPEGPGPWGQGWDPDGNPIVAP